MTGIIQRLLIKRLRKRLNMPVILGMPEKNTDEEVLQAAVEYDKQYARGFSEKRLIPVEMQRAINEYVGRK